MIRFDCVTLFTEMFAAVTESGITRRALEEPSVLALGSRHALPPAGPGTGAANLQAVTTCGAWAPARAFVFG